MRKNRVWHRSLPMLALALAMLFSSCANDPEEFPDEPLPDPSSQPSEAEQSDTEPEPMENVAPIFADLNDDGTDDKIFITYDDDQKRAATIRVISGKDGVELFSDTLGLDSGKTGAYYLQIGERNYPDKLVFWHYGYPLENTLAFAYGVFRYQPDGKIIREKNEEKLYDIGPDAKLASANIPFGVMVAGLNECIQISVMDEYTAYLLLDNQGETIVASTKDRMLAPEALTFTLEHFVR